MKRISGALSASLVALALTSVPGTAQDLDDAAIAHIAVTANQLDVTAGEQALEKTSNAEVRRFAETMIRDHNGVIQQAAALANRLGVSPRTNATSEALSSGAAEARARLGGLRGAAFDRAYMQNEVAYHEAVINAVEQTLIPNTRNGELKALLQNVLPALRAHLEHARDLRDALGEQ